MLQILLVCGKHLIGKERSVMEKPVKIRGFRPKGETLAMIENAEKMELNISELVNTVLDQHLKPYYEAAVRDRRKELRKMLEVAA